MWSARLAVAGENILIIDNSDCAGLGPALRKRAALVTDMGPADKSPRERLAMLRRQGWRGGLVLLAAHRCPEFDAANIAVHDRDGPTAAVLDALSTWRRQLA